MIQPQVSSDSQPDPLADEALDPTGLLALATSAIGLGMVGLISLFQIIGVLS